MSNPVSNIGNNSNYLDSGHKLFPIKAQNTIYIFSLVFSWWTLHTQKFIVEQVNWEQRKNDWTRDSLAFFLFVSHRCFCVSVCVCVCVSMCVNVGCSSIFVWLLFGRLAELWCWWLRGNDERTQTLSLFLSLTIVIRAIFESILDGDCMFAVQWFFRIKLPDSHSKILRFSSLSRFCYLI